MNHYISEESMWPVNYIMILHSINGATRYDKFVFTVSGVCYNLAMLGFIVVISSLWLWLIQVPRHQKTSFRIVDVHLAIFCISNSNQIKSNLLSCYYRDILYKTHNIKYIINLLFDALHFVIQLNKLYCKIFIRLQTKMTVIQWEHKIR